MEIRNQSGNVFFTLFAIVTLIGVLGVGLSSFIKGPLRSSVSITRQSAAESKMSIAGQTAIMGAANSSNKGDCDSDGMVEPLEFRDAGSLPAPIGGGLIPLSIGVTKTDPWGTEFGYCVWDHGPVLLNATCQITSGTNRRLQGYNSTNYPSVAIISAGPDRKFTTTCRNFSSGPDPADTNGNGTLADAVDKPLIGKVSTGDDDIIYSQTYTEAANSTGGLWALKPADTNQAIIQKSLEVTGGANFTGTGSFQKIAAIAGDFLNIVSGLKIAGPTLAATCNTANKGVIRTNATSDGWEICDGSAWKEIAGAAGAAGMSWPLLAPSGALSSPNYNFASSTGSGFWYGSGALHLTSTGGIDLVAATQINLTGTSGDFRVASSGGVRIGDDTATCNAATEGTVKFVSDDYQYCNGTAWVAFETALPVDVCTPSAMTFTAQTGAAYNSDVTSNTVTISGLSEPCYFIGEFPFGGSFILGGTDTGKQFVKVQNGNSIALKARSHPGSSLSVIKIKNPLGAELAAWNLTTIPCPAATQTLSYTTPGTFTYTPPANTSNCTFTVTVKGGGGGNYASGGAKGGGLQFDFVPGNVQAFDILVGAGGTISGSNNKGGEASAIKYNNTLLAIAGGGGGGYSTYVGGRGAPYGSDFILAGQDGTGISENRKGRGGNNNIGGAGSTDTDLGGNGGSNGSNGGNGSFAVGSAGYAAFSVGGGGGSGRSTTGGGGGSGYGGGGGSGSSAAGGGGGGYLKTQPPYAALYGYSAADGGAGGNNGPGGTGSVRITWR